jgi:putative ABC transport system ATP-binding protein
VSDNRQMRVFAARGLTKTYRMGETEIHALRGVELEIAAGEFIVLLGPSGSGKSTLLNILGGLDTPTSGEILFKEEELSKADEAALTRYRREHVGFVFQFYNLIPSLSSASTWCSTSPSRSTKCTRSATAFASRLTS